MNFNFVDLSVLLPALLMIAFLGETVVEILKQFVIRIKMSELFVYFISIVVGLILAFSLHVSLFARDNLFAYYVGVVICGLVASRGANFVHNFFTKLPQK